MKKLYIYEDLDEITDSWHDGGGVVIVTGGDPDEAWRADVAKRYEDASFQPKLLTELGEPARVIEVPDTEEDSVLVFPDAGCC